MNEFYYQVVRFLDGVFFFPYKLFMVALSVKKGIQKMKENDGLFSNINLIEIFDEAYEKTNHLKVHISLMFWVVVAFFIFK